MKQNHKLIDSRRLYIKQIEQYKDINSYSL